MDDLAAFLKARLDEDEAAASAASPGPWRLNAEGDEVLAVDDVTVAEAFALSGRQLRATADHIARHDPARVLREVAAGRAILTAYWAASSQPEEGGLEAAVRHLAVVYSDHRGYRAKWKP
jgi:hypothetical protein